MKEVLRLYPAIPVFPREAAADDVLPSGHPVSAGEPGGGGICMLLDEVGVLHAVQQEM